MDKINWQEDYKICLGGCKRFVSFVASFTHIRYDSIFDVVRAGKGRNATRWEEGDQHLRRSLVIKLLVAGMEKNTT